MFRLFECCALSFFERFVLSFSLKIERFVSDSAEIWICGLYIEENGIRLASPRDIAAMKINAIEGRGTKKDFIDIYFLLQHYPLENILKFYADKYPDNSQFRALMSLTYFEDAEEQFMPEMLVAIDWDRIKSFIIDKVATLSL